MGVGSSDSAVLFFFVYFSSTLDEKGKKTKKPSTIPTNYEIDFSTLAHAGGAHQCLQTLKAAGAAD